MVCVGGGEEVAKSVTIFFLGHWPVDGRGMMAIWPVYDMEKLTWADQSKRRLETIELYKLASDQTFLTKWSILNRKWMQNRILRNIFLRYVFRFFGSLKIMVATAPVFLHDCTLGSEPVFSLSLSLAYMHKIIKRKNSK